ncbi:hypothetical protein LWI28_001362 [Acer negundo]|uniref:ATP-dependent Clp protease proteolytic subunit n=1 Tax=Acer negundo TaxID=4023 RepID=A0AAD5JHN7_ACENE|nr:hypothetical protein LWI28_001362 [Acer negundo]
MPSMIKSTEDLHRSPGVATQGHLHAHRILVAKQVMHEGIQTPPKTKQPRETKLHSYPTRKQECKIKKLDMEAEELLKLREILTRVYVQRTSKPLWVVSKDMERDTFMSATEAQTHGIVDFVAVG